MQHFCKTAPPMLKIEEANTQQPEYSPLAHCFNALNSTTFE